VGAWFITSLADNMLNYVYTPGKRWNIQF